MTENDKQTVCLVCGNSFPEIERVPISEIRPDILSAITAKWPNLPAEGYLCFEDYHAFRVEHLRQGLQMERHHLEKLEEFLKKSIVQHDESVKNLKASRDEQVTLGERMADRIADIGGSWRFIFGFIAFLVAWIIINTVAFFTKPPDPYPYILLNLVLSCLAALQAPIIMMSQNRQEDKDRERAEHDWTTDLKAEMEIRHLNARVDFLVSHRWERLIEIQEIQLDMMEHMRAHPSHMRGDARGGAMDRPADHK